MYTTGAFMAEQILIQNSQVAGYAHAVFNSCAVFLPGQHEHVQPVIKVIILPGHREIAAYYPNNKYLIPRQYCKSPRIARYKHCICKKCSVKGNA